jgi:hypothetical protein
MNLISLLFIVLYLYIVFRGTLYLACFSGSREIQRRCKLDRQHNPDRVSRTHELIAVPGIGCDSIPFRKAVGLLNQAFPVFRSRMIAMNHERMESKALRTGIRCRDDSRN